MNATVAVVGNPTSNKGKGAEVGKQVVELLQEAGRKHGFNVIDVTGESFDDSLANARNRRNEYDYLVAATAIKATPDMVPEPSSDPRIQANQCFTRRFTLPIPFRPASIKWLPIVFHNMFHTSYVASSKPHRPPCTGHNQQSRISLRRDQHASEQR